MDVYKRSIDMLLFSAEPRYCLDIPVWAVGWGGFSGPWMSFHKVSLRLGYNLIAPIPDGIPLGSLAYPMDDILDTQQFRQIIY